MLFDFRRTLGFLAAFALLAARGAAAQDVLVLRLPFQSGSPVTATLPDGRSVDLGRIGELPVKTNWPAYTASRWGVPGTVCATAVNAVHLLLGVEKDRGRIVSIVPKVTVAPAASGGAFFSVDAPAGTGIFGAFAPFTGSRAFIERQDGTREDLRRLPARGETLVIETALPEHPKTWMVEIENRPGGRVTAWTRDGPVVAARVLRPLAGIGRFGGTEFQGTGRIRASHTGVIDVATAPRGQVGGFQIMPLLHALTSPEMASAWKMTQWMIVAPLPGREPLEGTPPLFKGTLVPGAQPNERLTDLWSTYGRRPLVLARFDGGGWTRLPDLSGRVDNALNRVTHLRVYYPFWTEPDFSAD